jgi:hypothetical protein
MIFAKLIAVPVNAQISSATTPASSNGISVTPVREAPQRNEEQNRDGSKRKNACFDKGGNNGSPGLIEADREPSSRQFCGQHSGRELLQHLAVICIALWKSLGTGVAVRRDPIANQVRRKRVNVSVESDSMIRS